MFRVRVCPGSAVFELLDMRRIEPVCLSVCLFLCLSVSLSVRLSVCVSVYSVRTEGKEIVVIYRIYSGLFSGVQIFVKGHLEVFSWF